jgi:hypothetical protein
MCRVSKIKKRSFWPLWLKDSASSCRVLKIKKRSFWPLWLKDSAFRRRVSKIKKRSFWPLWLKPAGSYFENLTICPTVNDHHAGRP